MQPSTVPTPADCRARKARLQLTYDEIAAALAALGYSYPAGRLRKIYTESENYPDRVCAASWEAFDAIEERRRRAADGERAAQDELDDAETSRRQLRRRVEMANT